VVLDSGESDRTFGN